MANTNIRQLTDSYVKIRLQNLPTNRYLYINAILWDSSDTLIYNDPYQTYSMSIDYFDIEFDNLNANSNYTYRFIICYDNYYDDGGTLVDFINGSFTTTSGGGGNPTYTFSVAGSNININIVDANSNCQFWAYLYDNPYGSGSPLYSSVSYSDTGGLAGISNGIYYLNIYYSDYYTAWKDLQNYYTGQTYSEVRIGSGSGTPTYTVSKSGNSISINIIDAGSGCEFSSYLYYGPNETGGVYDSSHTYNDYDAFSNMPDGTYYLRIYYRDNNLSWRYLQHHDTGQVETVITIGSGGNIPSFVASVINTNQISFSVSDRGNYYLRYFVRLTNSPQTTIYDTWEQYGSLVSNTTLTVSNLSYNTSYTVNVGYSTTSSSGTVTWIGSQILSTGSQPITTWEEIYVGDVNMTNINRSFNRSISSYKTYRYNITFSTSGKTRIYCTGGSSSADPIAYFGTTNSGISYNDGIPIDWNVRWDDVVENSVRNYNFDSGEIDIVAGTTYYLWVKGIDNGHTPDLVIYINAPSNTSGCVWIYTGSGANQGWKKAIPYIYTGSGTNQGWKQAQAYIYNGTAWKKTTE